MISKDLFEKAEPIIKKIAQSKKGKKFAYFTPEDIEQEVWVLCLDALERYDENIGPIENFLNRHVSNRLKNLKRDKYFNPNIPSGLCADRINIVNAIPTGLGDSCNNGKSVNNNSFIIHTTNDIERIELLNIIQHKLPEYLLDSFIDLINGNKIEESILIKIRHEVDDILLEIDYYEQ